MTRGVGGSKLVQNSMTYFMDRPFSEFQCGQNSNHISNHMESLSKLRYADEKYKKISIAHDMTTSEAKRREVGGMDLQGKGMVRSNENCKDDAVNKPKKGV